VLGIFFLLVWVSVIAALTGHDRARGRLMLAPGYLDEEFRNALSRSDHEVLARYYRVALKRSLPARDEQLIRINLACALNGLSEHAQALEELDRVALQQLSPPEVALWLNNRAYTLVFLAQPADAIDNLKDADELLAGEEGGTRDPLLTACISGTRGIALLHHGDLDGAERSLELALRQEDEGVARQFDPEWQADPARTAERWYWLGEIARRRGDLAAARLRFQRASASPTVPFGRRARTILADPAGLAAEPPESAAIATSVATAGSDRNSDTAIKR
jgi:tetratricopeptide (TPR) repeat protein